MPESASTGSPQGTLLGFDFGLRRIGVAVGQTMTGTASALTTIHCGKEPDWVALDALIKEWRPRLIVVGLPLAADGSQTPMSGRARKFGRTLAERAGCKVEFMDERLTSKEAEGAFAERRASGTARRKDSQKLDALSAAIILENWLQSVTYDQP